MQVTQTNEFTANEWIRFAATWLTEERLFPIFYTDFGCDLQADREGNMILFHGDRNRFPVKYFKLKVQHETGVEDSPSIGAQLDLEPHELTFGVEHETGDLLYIKETHRPSMEESAGTIYRLIAIAQHFTLELIGQVA